MVELVGVVADGGGAATPYVLTDRTYDVERNLDIELGPRQHPTQLAAAGLLAAQIDSRYHEVSL